MSKRGLGLMLILLFALGVGAAALLQTVRFDRSLTDERLTAEQVARRVETTQVAIANLRGAQAGYLAIGQGPDFWMKRASELAGEIEKNLGELQATATAEARPHYDAAMSLLGGFNSLDQKARADLANDDRLLASDVIFMDLGETTQRLTAALAAGREADQGTREARVGGLRRARLQLDAAALGILILTLAAVSVRRPRPVAAPDAGVRRTIAPEVETPPAVTSVVEPAVASPPAKPVLTSAINLSEAAQICIDLARVLDGRDIPPLLERAARILEAKGLVLWVADTTGATLHPSLGHGYSDKVLQRIGALPADADNVTSLAFRSMQPQTFSSPSNGATNAIAVPLITSTGCVGVLSAEVSQPTGGADRLAVARMFAAQLATLVKPSTAVQAEQAVQG